MEVPTLKEIVDQLEWESKNTDSVDPKHRLEDLYEWEDEKWKVVMEPWTNGQYVNWHLELRSSAPITGQCRNINDAVVACANALLDQINVHKVVKLRKEKQQRKLDEHKQKGQEWADKANSVSIED